MAGDRSWRAYTGPVDEARLALHKRVLDADLRIGTLALGALRRKRGVSQATVADALDVSQPNISRIEQQEDIRLSTLGHYVAALGGQLEVRAVFGDETVELIGDPEPPGER
jgi:DNA-binding XRE family transcriptional regulator